MNRNYKTNPKSIMISYNYQIRRFRGYCNRTLAVKLAGILNGITCASNRTRSES